jgi:hypothetical protein
MNKHWLILFATGFALSGCTLDSVVSDDGSGSGASTGSKIFALGTKYSSDGGTAALDRVSNDTTLAKGLKTLATSDAVLDRDSGNGILYVINRGAATVTGFKSIDPSQVSLDVNVGNGSNPYAVAVLSGKLWVACYGSAFLKAVSLSSQKLVDSIDLSAYADVADRQTNPYAFAVHAWNGKIAVVLGRMNGWKPGDSSLVLVVDPTTKAVEKRIALPWKNAYGAAWSGDKLLVACVGVWGALDGGLVEVDLSTGAAKALLSEATAGFDITAVAFGPGSSAYVGLYKSADYTTSVWTANLSAGGLGAKVSGDADVGSFAWDGSHLWMGTTTSTLRRATSTGAVLNTFSTTLSPTSLAVLP